MHFPLSFSLLNGYSNRKVHSHSFLECTVKLQLNIKSCFIKIKKNKLSSTNFNCDRILGSPITYLGTYLKKDKHLWRSAYQYGSKRLVQSSVTSAKVIKFNRLKLVKIRTQCAGWPRYSVFIRLYEALFTTQVVYIQASSYP